MTEQHKSALTPAEWAQVRQPTDYELYTSAGGVVSVHLGHVGDGESVFLRTKTERAWAAIALLNNALPDGDERKVTREMVNALRERVECGDNAPLETIDHAHHVLAILESILRQ